LAAFLAAFFFFFAMDMAPCREHPDTNLTPISVDAQGRKRTTFRRPCTVIAHASRPTIGEL
jgi:hypothetical protein